jgi:hypothetical protein
MLEGYRDAGLARRVDNKKEYKAALRRAKRATTFSLTLDNFRKDVEDSKQLDTYDREIARKKIGILALDLLIEHPILQFGYRFSIGDNTTITVNTEPDKPFIDGGRSEIFPTGLSIVFQEDGDKKSDIMQKRKKYWQSQVDGFEIGIDPLERGELKFGEIRQIEVATIAKDLRVFDPKERVMIQPTQRDLQELAEVTFKAIAKAKANS